MQREAAAAAAAAAATAAETGADAVKNEDTGGASGTGDDAKGDASSVSVMVTVGGSREVALQDVTDADKAAMTRDEFAAYNKLVEESDDDDDDDDEF